MKKNLLLFATLFFTIASVAVPLLGFALLEPSASNLFIISMLFVLAVFGSVAYCDLWVQERRREANEFEEDMKKAFKQMNREEMKAMFKQIDNQ